MADDFALPPEKRQRGRQSRSWTCAQWVLLIAMGGLLLGVVGALVWVGRAGLAGEPVDVLATVAAQPSPSPTPPLLVPDAVPTPTELYTPPEPQPLAVSVAPGDIRWWDARFAYRRRIEFDALAAGLPAGMWARVAFDGEGAQVEGKMRSDGADLRVVAWDGDRWWELPRSAEPRREVKGWRVVFPLQDRSIAQQGGYYLYYGYAAAPPAPTATAVPESPRLLLSLGMEEGVE
jgi:hypothetical protein